MPPHLGHDPRPSLPDAATTQNTLNAPKSQSTNGPKSQSARTVFQGLSILDAASLRRKVVTSAKAGAGFQSLWVLDSGFRRNDGLPFAQSRSCGAGSARAEARGSDWVAWANEMPRLRLGGMGKLVCPWLAPSFPPGQARPTDWIPACAGMTGHGVRMTGDGVQGV
jgi:hypothetical protein